MERSYFKYYNAHPEGKRVNDCVKRAITLVAQMDYHQVQLELNRYKKVTGAKYFNSDHNPHKYCENVLHMAKLSFPAVAGEERMNGKRFTQEYPYGRYILNMAGHWSACVNGKIYDTWDCSDKCVYTAYQMLEPEEIKKVIEIEEKNKAYELELKKQKELQKAKAKKIKDKYAKKIKPLQKKIKELEKLMNKEIDLIKGVA